MIRSKFSNCPLIWMFYSRKWNSLINKIHERPLTVLGNDKPSYFKTFLCFHQMNLQVEFCKIIIGYVQLIMNILFAFGEKTQNNKHIRVVFHENKRNPRYIIG